METCLLNDQTPVTIRPIRPEDEPIIVQFHKELSQETVRQRFLKTVNYDDRVAHDRMIRICFNDYDREIALILARDQEILGIIRLTKIPGTLDATFALLVKDKWQNKGIGTKLMQKILDVAKAEKVETIRAEMLDENFQMQKLCKRFGFTLVPSGKLVFAQHDLKAR